MPSELAERAAELLAEEPAHPEPAVTYRHCEDHSQPFTLRSFLGPHAPQLAGAVALVVLETIALQAGPLLTQVGIDRGILAGRFDVLVVITVIYVAVILIGAVTSSIRIRFTSRLGEGLMYGLRIRVFAHLERQGLDFFTGERTGRLMTRMTSDIEALTQLFQDGLVNLLVQGLTLAVIAAVLISLNPLLGLITLALVVPAMLVLTMWFRSASDRGYRAVRDRIAEVLSDLQESLAGIRLIAAHNRRDRNIEQHGDIVAAHKDAKPLHRPGRRHLRARIRSGRHHRPSAIAANRRSHGSERHPDRRGTVCVSALPNSLFHADSAVDSAVQRLSARPIRDRQAAGPPGDSPVSCRSRGCPRASAHRR